MSSVSTSIQSSGNQGVVITDELLAINMRHHHNRTDEGSDFRQVMEHIETSSIRYPGGTITEEHFDITDPNATRVENAIQVIHPDLIPERSDVPIVRTVTPLSDYLSFVNERGGEPVVVLPTYRFFDQATRTATANAEADIRGFIRELMTDTYGQVDKLTLEVGNEFYQGRFNWTDAEFGQFQAKLAEWIDDEAKQLGLRDDLTMLIQVGRNPNENAPLVQPIQQLTDVQIDGVILHFYGTSGVGNPLAMGGNIPRELSETTQTWASILGADFEIAVTEWNVGENGENSTIVNGTMRSAPLLFMFAEMVKGGVDTAMIWAARTDGPAGLSLRRDEGGDLTPTGMFYEMLSESVHGLSIVDNGQDERLLNSSGQHVGYTYTFEGADRSVTYFVSGVNHGFALSADLTAQMREGAYVYARVLDAAPGEEATGYWSDAAKTYTTDVALTQVNGQQVLNIDVNPYQLIELHIVHGQGVTIEADREHNISDDLMGSDFNDRLEGEKGSDKLTGLAGDDNLYGGLGADILRGNEGNDQLKGGDGHDRLLGGTGNDDLAGGKGKDRLFGHDDNDVISGERDQDELYGENGDDILKGGKGKDSLFGGDGADVLNGGIGADTLDGGAGNDVLSGQLGADFVYGGTGNDTLQGNNGDDQLFGGAGDDRLEGGLKKDSLTGGEGADQFVFAQASGRDVITDFEDGTDAIVFMIQGFGFENLSILQDGDDALIRHGGGLLRVSDIDVALLGEDDFRFNES